MAIGLVKARGNKNETDCQARSELQQGKRLFYQELEPRIVFDAAMVATGEEVLAEDGTSETDDTATTQATAEAEASADELDLALTGYLEEPNTTKQIVFIDAAVEDIDTLISAIDPGFEVFVLDMTGDGIEQALLSAMPAWGRFDPIVVLVLRDGKQKDIETSENQLSKAEKIFEKAV